MLILTQENGNVRIVRIAVSVLNIKNVRELKNQLVPFLTVNFCVVLDMSLVDAVDSSVLGALLTCLKQAHAIGGMIKLSGLKKPIRAIFELVRMYRFFEIFNSTDEAVISSGAKLKIA